jgi:hypothetical protein
MCYLQVTLSPRGLRKTSLTGELLYIKVKVYLWLIEHHAMKAYGGLEI